jgi:teichuronic acid biosynthesis glycosyltransferase TuaG
MPHVSVIMLSYNYGTYLSEAIESVLNQTYSNFELIIVDDCSTDGSAAIIRKYGHNDKRIKYLIHPKNAGIARSFNEGLEQCSGDLIAYISSDDVWEEKRLEKGVDVLDAEQDIDYLYSDLSIIDEKGKLTGKRGHELYKSQTGEYSGNLFNTLIRGNFIGGTSMFLRRQSMGSTHLNDELKYLNDWLFFIELAEKGKFYYIPDTLARYRVHSNSTNLDKIGYITDYIKLVEIMKYKYKDYFDKNERVLVSHYGAIGYMLFSSGDLKEGRRYLWKYLWKTVHVFPSNVKTLRAIALSFLGTKVFNKTVEIYRRYFAHTV